MAIKSGSEFFLDEKLYKVVRIDRSNDEVICWEFASRKRVSLSYSYVRQNAETAYRIDDVAELINRNRTYIRNLVYNGDIAPTAEYRAIETNRLYGLRWSPKGVMELREYFASKHFGRPRADGAVIPRNLPTRQELRAMLDQKVTLYVKTDDGQFVPTWKA